MEVSWKDRLSLCYVCYEHQSRNCGPDESGLDPVPTGLDLLHSQRLIGAMTLIWVREHHLQLNWSLYLNREHGIDDLATERVAVFSSARWPDYMQFAIEQTELLAPDFLWHNLQKRGHRRHGRVTGQINLDGIVCAQQRSRCSSSDSV